VSSAVSPQSQFLTGGVNDGAGALMHYVTAVKYESGYRLRLRFDDGSVKVVDLESHLDGEVFEPLRDIRRFRTARLNPDLDTVVWENGADMSPDFLYDIGVPAGKPGRTTAAVAEPRAKYRRTCKDG
jgi:hypothetical protein